MIKHSRQGYPDAKPFAHLVARFKAPTSVPSISYAAQKKPEALAQPAPTVSAQQHYDAGFKAAVKLITELKAMGSSKTPSPFAHLAPGPARDNVAAKTTARRIVAAAELARSGNGPAPLTNEEKEKLFADAALRAAAAEADAIPPAAAALLARQIVEAGQIARGENLGSEK